MSSKYWGGVLIAVALLTGCDTESELLNQRLQVALAEEAALLAVKKDLATPAALEGPGTASVFVSSDLINGVLAGADGVVVDIPNVRGGKLTLVSLRTDFRAGFPLVRVQATARKEGMDAALSMEGYARVRTEVLPTEPRKLRLSVHVESLLPSAKWGIFDFRIQGFVRELLQVKLSDAAKTVGVIELPVATTLPIVLPAKTTPVSMKGINAAVSTPQIAMNGSAQLTRVIALPDGIHLYGSFKAE